MKNIVLRNGKEVLCSEGVLIDLAKNDPFWLRDIILNTDDRFILSFGAEHLLNYNHNCDYSILLAVIKLLDSESIFIREGAIYGLSNHLENKEVLRVLSNRIKIEEDHEIRQLINEMIEDWIYFKNNNL